ncbi:MAG: hypothetical protein ACRDD1_16485, partial [Planctomycetia bacterium]
GEYGERQARHCCANDSPCACGCGARCEGRRRTVCEGCRRALSDARFNRLPVVEWDHETPLLVWDDDLFLFSEDEVAEHLGDRLADGYALEDVQLELCERVVPPLFEMHVFLCDDLHEDAELPPTDAIEKTVNDWIDANFPTGWTGGGKRIAVESLRAIADHWKLLPERGDA